MHVWFVKIHLKVNHWPWWTPRSQIRTIFLDREGWSSWDLLNVKYSVFPCIPCFFYISTCNSICKTICLRYSNLYPLFNNLKYPVCPCISYCGGHIGLHFFSTRKYFRRIIMFLLTYYGYILDLCPVYYEKHFYNLSCYGIFY